MSPAEGGGMEISMKNLFRNSISVLVISFFTVVFVAPDFSEAAQYKDIVTEYVDDEKIDNALEGLNCIALEKAMIRRLQKSQVDNTYAKKIMELDVKKIIMKRC